MLKILILCLFSIVLLASAVFMPGCANFICHIKEDISSIPQLQKFRACDECRKLKSRFCGKFQEAFYCLPSIPPFCKPVPNSAQQRIANVSDICYIPPKAFLPIPLIENNQTLSIAIPRFFEQEQFEQYHFHNLSLFLLFPLANGENCSKGLFPSRTVHKGRDCLWTIPIAMPTIDSAVAKNDPFYYDDQTDMSVSFSPKLIPVVKNGKMSIWYSVNADLIVTHQNVPVNFSLTIYSYRKDISSE